MKKIIFTIAFAATILACKNEKNEEVLLDETVETMAIAKNYQTFGDEISDAEILTTEEMNEKFQNLKVGDTVNLKFVSEVKEVCQKKGCWMKVDLGEEEAMVRFKDYAFFMPKDLAGKEIILGGKAYIEEMSVEDQRHYAEDGGATPEEALAITEPKRTFSFEANGVLIPEVEKQ